MNAKKLSLLIVMVTGLGFALWLFLPPSISSDLSLELTQENIARGEYLVTAGGCESCHRADDGSSDFSGGHGLETDFGTFYAPNITPDDDTGIGQWTGKDFIAALKYGRTPSGSFYYPAFPYRAYAGLTDQDALDIGAYLLSLEAVSNSVSDPETPAWLFRWSVAGWNLLADLTEGSREQVTEPELERGAYLARNLGHCSECHTPRSGLGIPDYSRDYAGAQIGEEVIEAIDADALADWTKESFELFLLLGMKPSGEFVGGDMNDVIEHNTSKLTDEDRLAMAAYFTRHQ